LRFKIEPIRIGVGVDDEIGDEFAFIG